MINFKLILGMLIIVLYFIVIKPNVFAIENNILQKNLPVEILINEKSIIKKADKVMLGYDYDWLGTEYIFFDNNQNTNIFKDQIIPFINEFKDIPMPLNRMAGTDSQAFRWKFAIGPYSERKEMKLWNWDKISKKKLGPIEWIQSVLAVDPNAKFSWTLNMITENPEDHSDLALFLLGNKKNPNKNSIDWVGERIKFGLSYPVNVEIWELGNELDWKQYDKIFPTPETYIEVSKKTIEAIRRIQPNAKFAVHAATNPMDKEYHSKRQYKSWEIWHKKVIEGLGDQINYIVYHPYYVESESQAKHEANMNLITADIKKITGSNRIKFYISEHGVWPIASDISKPWKDSWYKTHSLSGVLSTAEWLTRMFNRSDVYATAYHAFSSGPWALIYKDAKTHKLYTTGILDLYKILNESYIGNVVKCKIDGKFSDTDRDDCTLTTSAIVDKDRAFIIIVNRDPYINRAITFKFQRKYKLLKETILTAKDMDAYNKIYSKEIKVTKTIKTTENIIEQYTMPAKSVVVLELLKKV